MSGVDGDDVQGAVVSTGRSWAQAAGHREANFRKRYRLFLSCASHAAISIEFLVSFSTHQPHVFARIPRSAPPARLGRFCSAVLAAVLDGRHDRFVNPDDADRLDSGAVSGTAHKIVVVGDPVLSQPCAEVTSFDDELARLIDDMFVTMEVAEGVGLAAPQIGVSRAVFVYDCPDADGQHQRGHMVNPVVVSADGPLEESDEGCLSVPGPVPRAGAGDPGDGARGRPYRQRRSRSPAPTSSLGACCTRPITCAGSCSSTTCPATVVAGSSATSSPSNGTPPSVKNRIGCIQVHPVDLCAPNSRMVART